MIESEQDRQALLREAGVPARFLGRTINVYFQERHDTVEVNGKDVRGVELYAMGSSLDLQKARRGSPITIGNRGFVVESVEPDGQGMTKCMLKYVD